MKVVSQLRAAFAIAGLTAVMLMSTIVSAFAADTPTLGGGDCWQNGTPQTCRNTWAGVSTYIYFRAIDNYSSWDPSWNTSASTAVTNWSNAPGPQFYSFTPTSNDTWIYLHYDWTGDHGLGSTMDGLTWNCDLNGYCVDTNTAMFIKWSDVYVNRDVVGNGSSTLVTETFAHESGHAMGLFHNTTVSTALMWTTVNNQTVPQSVDLTLTRFGGHPSI